VKVANLKLGHGVLVFSFVPGGLTDQA